MNRVLWTAIAGLWASGLISLAAWWPGLRTYPQVPLIGATGGSVFLDYLCCVGWVFATVAVAISSRKRLAQPLGFALWSFVGVGLLFYLNDQTRLQPWFYQYEVVLICLAIGAARSKEAHFDFLSAMLGGIYFWSGVHKINPGFRYVYEWLVAPLERDVLFDGIWALPAVEIAIGLLLIVPGVFPATKIPFKKIGAAGAIVMHLLILLMIGPVFHNWNQVVWPWNLAMIFWAWTILRGDQPLRWARGVREVAVAVFWILPSLHLWDLWNGYLSFSLYSGSISRAEIRDARSDDLVLDFDDWSVPDLGLPTVPVFNVYRAAFDDYCLKNSHRAGEIYMNFEEVDRWKWKIKSTRFHCK